MLTTGREGCSIFTDEPVLSPGSRAYPACQTPDDRHQGRFERSHVVNKQTDADSCAVHIGGTRF